MNTTAIAEAQDTCRRILDAVATVVVGKRPALDLVMSGAEDLQVCVAGLGRRFGACTALQGLDLRIESGERFGLLANALEDVELRELYRGFTRADARHQRLFVDLARHYFDEDVIVERANEMLSAEASFVTGLPVRPALY